MFRALHDRLGVERAVIVNATPHGRDNRVVTDAIAQLSAEHKAVLVHVYYGGRSIAETAAELGIPPGTVKSRLHYGLRALRLALEEKGVTG